MALALGLQILLQPSRLWLMAKEIQPPVMVYFQPGDSVPIKPELTLGRFHYGDQSFQLTNNPIGFGEKLAHDAIASASKNGIEYWVGPTEPPVASPEDCARLVACEKRRVDILNAEGLKAVVFYLSVGWPLENVETHTLYTGQFDEFLKHLHHQNMVGLNEYFYPTGPLHPDSYDPDRPSRIWRFKHWPQLQHDIVITECGMDIGGKPETDGWVRQCPPGMNLEQWFGVYTGWMQDYRNLISQDDRVVGMAWYCGGPGYGWGDYDVLPYIEQAQPLFAAPKVTNIRVKIKGNGIITMPVEEYLRGVVPAEMPALWHTDALRSQSVLARSYAMWRMDNPRSELVDIYGDTRDQVYNPKLIHDRTDAAIASTAGIYLAQNGKPFMAQYVSTCGQIYCTYCWGQPGYTNEGNPDGVWRGRACQWGMKELADYGRNWRDISTWYYPDSGVYFSDKEGP